ncbi:MAG: acyl-CoA dehydrogenase family protein [Myxococcales bacterium]
MDFEFSEDQQLLAKTAADFVSKRSPVSRARKLREDATGYEMSVWREMAELGWLSIPFSEQLGGIGGSFVDLALILEHLGRELVPEPFVPSVVLAGTVLAQGGSMEQQERFLKPMLAGETTLALAYAERDLRFDLETVNTVATKQNGSFVLSGEKVWVQNGHAAHHIVVSAAHDGWLQLFVVDRDTPGLSIQRVDTIDGRRAAVLQFDDVKVASDRLLAQKPGTELLDLALDYGAAAAVAEGVGLTQRVLDLTIDYLKTREQFDVKIGAFQALQHRAVDMFIEAQLIRSIAFKSSVLVDQADPGERRAAVSAAKVQLSVGGKYVTRQAIQLHGGIGCTDEHDIGLYFKRMHVLNTLYGDEEHHVERYASSADFNR